MEASRRVAGAISLRLLGTPLPLHNPAPWLEIKETGIATGGASARATLSVRAFVWVKASVSVNVSGPIGGATGLAS